MNCYSTNNPDPVVNQDYLKKEFSSKQPSLFYIKFIIGCMVLGFLFLKTSFLYAQDSLPGLYLRSNLIIMPGTILSIQGNLQVSGNSSIINSGCIQLSGNLMNTSPGLFELSTASADTGSTIRKGFGTVIFNGKDTQYIIHPDSGIIYFNKFVLANNLILLGDSTFICDTLFFNKGLLDLNNMRLNLSNTFKKTQKTLRGDIGLENNDSRIFCDSNGFIYYNTNITEGMNNIGGTGLYLYPAQGMKLLSFQRYHQADTTITDGSVRKYYTISASASIPSVTGISGDLLIHYHQPSDYDSLIKEQHFIVFKKDSFASPTFSRQELVSRDTTNNIVRSKTNISASFYTLAEENCDVVPELTLAEKMDVCKGDVIMVNGFKGSGNPACKYHWDVFPELCQDEQVSNSDFFQLETDSLQYDSLLISLRIEDERGCYTIDSLMVFIHPLPALSITVTDSSGQAKKFFCQQERLFFRDTLNTGEHGEYAWDFNYLGKKSDAAQPVFSYPEDGTYSYVSLEYTDDYHCKSKKFIQLIIHPLPLIQLSSPQEVCDGEGFVISNNATNDAGISSSHATKSYRWTMDDSTIITWDRDFLDENGISPPLHWLFDEQGLHEVTLTITSQANCSADTSVQILVHESPRFSGSLIPVSGLCSGQYYRAVPDSIQNEVIIHSMEWQLFKNHSVIWDTTFPVPQSLDIYLNKSGEYELKQVLTSIHGCRDTSILSLTVYPRPESLFSFSDECIGDDVYLENNTLANVGYLFSWILPDTVMDGDISSPHFIYRFDSSGVYPVCLESVNNHGCRDTNCKNINIYPLPEVSFSVTNTCMDKQGEGLIFKSEAEACNSCSFLWSFGDGSSSSDEVALKRYSEPGSYQVQLLSENEHGCRSSYIDSIDLWPSVSADFQVIPDGNAICMNQPVRFVVSEKTLQNTTIGSFFWSINDEFIDSSTLIEYAFPEKGSNTVKLTVVNRYGCSDILAKEIVVSAPEEIKVATFPVCKGDKVLYVPSPPSVLGLYNAYEWKIQDSIVSTKAMFEYLFNKEGNYPISILAKGNNGCDFKDTILQTVHEIPDAMLGDDVSTCLDSLVIHAAYNPDWDYEWNGVAGVDSLQIMQDGSYSLKVTDLIRGCVSRDTIQVLLHSNLDVELGNDTAVCGAILLDAANNGHLYQWSDGTHQQTLELREAGTYHIFVTVTAPGSVCSAVDSINVRVYRKPEIDVFSDTTLCENQQLLILPAIEASGIITWQDSVVSKQYLLTYQGNQTEKVKVELMDSNNCRDMKTITVHYHSLPRFDLGEEKSICQGHSIILSTGLVNIPVCWNNGLCGENIKVEKQGTYLAMARNGTCFYSDSIEIKVSPLPSTSLMSNMKACEGDTIKLSQCLPGIATYHWSNGENACSIVITSRDMNVFNKYQLGLKVIDSNGCQSIPVYAEIEYYKKPLDFLDEVISSCNEITLKAPVEYHCLWNQSDSGQIFTIEKSGTYSLRAMNKEGCLLHDTLVALIKSTQHPEIGTSVEICQGSTHVLSPVSHDSIVSYQWNTGSSGTKIKVDAQGMYWLRVKYENGCEASDSVFVRVNQTPQPYLGKDLVICDNESIVLDAGYESCFYHWTSSSGLDEHVKTITVKDSGTYFLCVTTYEGCASRDTIRISSAGQSLTAQFLSASLVKAGDTIFFKDLSYPDPLYYSWNFGDFTISREANPSHVYFSTDTFIVRLHISNGVCDASMAKPVVVSGYNKCLLPADEDSLIRDIASRVYFLNARQYPNPTSGIFHCEIEISTPAPVDFWLFNLQGKLFDHYRADCEGYYRATYDISSLQKGFYILRISCGLDVRTFKIIKI